MSLRTCLAAMLVLGAASPLWACDNDKETEPYEYRQQRTYPNPILALAKEPGVVWPTIGAVTFGGLSLLGTSVMVVRRRRTTTEADAAADE